MAIPSHLLLLICGDNSENISSIKSKQMLADSTNIHLEDCQTSSIVNRNGPIRTHRYRQRQTPLTLNTFYRYEDAIKHKNQLSTCCLDKNKILIDVEPLKDILSFQEKDYRSLDQSKERAIYNARQTPLIPLITDLDSSSLSEPSHQQNDLVIDILSLANHIEEECSFFEQFRI